MDHDESDLDAEAAEVQKPTPIKTDISNINRSGIIEYDTTTTKQLKQAIYNRKSSISDGLKPELVVGRSEILDYDDIKHIAKQLTKKTGPWNLHFSTTLHGCTLEKLYNKMDGLDGPILLVIKDKNKNVFGAYLSDALHLSDAYYGNIETFLFTLQPTFKAFPATKSNLFFIKGDSDSVFIGSDKAGHKEKFALQLHKNLVDGQTGTSETFANPPLVSEGKFSVRQLECWHFTYID